ncbi:hypothetical protein HPO96_33010 [Kribbella sandramycini]|uniref:YacP-like NYN domain-containing protein n=1 Tax=Kribbella sandramycini TaxID=60450 RepID=A0A7Y4P4F6_9ACTN|nr:hypothetical protein [Kribbella sandramycini]MBB6566079.1 hypothetical protein [Kribbella sandramycini]NOL45080.1 hypothetical protein [Kribbella sandramycini]
MSTPKQQVVVVDAANVIGSRPDGWWRDRAGAARRFVLKLAELNAKLPDTSIVVVLEGAARRALPTPDAPDAPDLGDLRVVLASGSGDDTITAVTADLLTPTNPPPVTVVTADRGLRQRVEPLGAQTTGPTWLWTHLDNL